MMSRERKFERSWDLDTQRVKWKAPWHPRRATLHIHAQPRKLGWWLLSLISTHLIGSRATPVDLGSSLGAWHRHQL